MRGVTGVLLSIHTASTFISSPISGLMPNTKTKQVRAIRRCPASPLFLSFNVLLCDARFAAVVFFRCLLQVMSYR